MSQLDREMMDRSISIAQKSPILSRKVGVLIVDRDNNFLAQACNELPQGVHLPSDLDLNSETSKAFWVEHAERKAIYDASVRGVSLKESTIYSTLFPCTSCMRAIIQSKIATLVAPLPDHTLSKWSTEFHHAKMMQENSTLTYRPYTCEETSQFGALG